MRLTDVERRTGRREGTGGRPEMFERLRADPDTRTLGQLLQERQWALHEIERLTGLRVPRLLAPWHPSALGRRWTITLPHPNAYMQKTFRAYYSEQQLDLIRPELNGA